MHSLHRRSHFALFLLCLALLASPPLVHGQTDEDAQPALALTNVTVIDGTGAQPVPNRTVVIRDGVITEVLDAESEGPPEDVRILDLSGRYVIPGLIDTHVHLGPSVFEDYSRSAELERLQEALSRGITSVRDMASDARTLASLSRDAKVGDITSPDIYYSALMAGPSFFAEDHRVDGSARGDVAGEVSWHRAVTEHTDIGQAIAEAKGAGAVAIKLYADLAPDLVRRLTEEAHRQGLQVWAHAALHPARARGLVEAGVDAISHVNLLAAEVLEQVPDRFHGASAAYAAMDPEAIDVASPLFSSLFERMAKQGMVLDATVRLYTLDMEHQYGPDDVDLACRLVRRAKDVGVPISTGTDGNRMPLHEEIDLLTDECGFTPLEAIRAATLHGAMAIGIEATRGSVEVGKRADLVMLGSDPTEDVRNLRDVHLVIKGGRVFDVEAPPSSHAESAGGSAAGEPEPLQQELQPEIEHTTGVVFPPGLPFSEAVRVGDVLFLAGSIGTKPGTESEGEAELVPGGITPETRQAMEHIRTYLEAAGSSMDRIARCTVYLADMDEWSAFNAVYETYFDPPYPARTAVGVDELVLGARVEVECVAAAGKTDQ